MVDEEKNIMNEEITEPSVVSDLQPKKKSHKKAIIITSVVAAGAVAVGAGVPAILSMKKGAEQQYLKENPTKYLANSVTKYFDEQEKDNGAYNFAKGIYKAGGLKFTYNAQGTEVSAVAGYDSDKKQAYIDASGKMSVMGTEQNASIKSYVDSDSFNIDYDAMGSKGSYFIDLKNLKNDFEGSVFADKNSALYSEQFEQMINNFEKSYDISQKDQEMKKDFDETISKICKSIETNGHVEINNQKVNIQQKDYSADIVTYDFKAADISKLLDECKNYLVDYMTKYKDDIFQTYEYFSVEDMQKEIDSSIDSAKNSMSQDIEMKVEFFISSDTQQMLKVLYTQTEGDNKGTISLSFPPDSETLFDFNVSSTGEKYKDNAFNCALTKKSTADNITYKFTANTKDNPQYSITFDYNQKDSKLKITNLTDPSAEPIQLTPNELIARISSANINNFTVEFNFECTNDKISIGDESWNLQLSATPTITPFKAEKNFFKMTEDEIQSAFPGIIGNRNSIIENANKSQKQTNASALDSTCKRLYASTVAGSINSETPIEELGALDPSKLPAPNATVAQKREAAQNLTIQDAIDYDNLTELFADESPYDYAYNTADGTIIYFDEDTDYEKYDLITGFDYTTLGELYHN